ncbi:hypothetical protein SLEP1_g42645 [Rubroshorea leprosula]|uniref:Uncharacterized protein n=1 Tax=Rubroshorea leprosula TaxID=152421 RepID=A0AAV5LC02_9ROSI|nr:hypothetical protein SLEP1_g42645 [Rubroshorea leprosula]
MATAGNGEVMGKEDAKEGTGKILWLFPRLRFSNQEPKKPNVEVREEVKLPKNPPPRSVFFGIRQTSLPPLEAEALESVGRTSNPAILWQCNGICSKILFLLMCSSESRPCFVIVMDVIIVHIVIRCEGCREYSAAIYGIFCDCSPSFNKIA